jgi:hypothetical protein
VLHLVGPRRLTRRTIVDDRRRAVRLRVGEDSGFSHVTPIGSNEKRTERRELFEFEDQIAVLDPGGIEDGAKIRMSMDSVLQFTDYGVRYDRCSLSQNGAKNTQPILLREMAERPCVEY